MGDEGEVVAADDGLVRLAGFESGTVCSFIGAADNSVVVLDFFEGSWTAYLDIVNQLKQICRDMFGF